MQRFFVRTAKTLLRLYGCAGRFDLRCAHMSEGTFSNAEAILVSVVVIRLITPSTLK